VFHVPLALDLIKDPEKKQILYLHFAPQAIGRPFAAPRLRRRPALRLIFSEHHSALTAEGSSADQSKPTPSGNLQGNEIS
jgi:hypothetical protein